MLLFRTRPMERLCAMPSVIPASREMKVKHLFPGSLQAAWAL